MVFTSNNNNQKSHPLKISVYSAIVKGRESLMGYQNPAEKEKEWEQNVIFVDWMDGKVKHTGWMKTEER